MKALLLLVVACGSPQAVAPPPPTPPRVVAIDASVPVDASPAVFSRDSLPEWPLVTSDSHNPPEGETEVYAADVDGDELLLALAEWDVLMVSSGKRISGRIKTDAPMHAFATIAGQLGVPERGMFVPRAKSTDAPVAMNKAGASFVEVMNVIGDVGNVNVVLPPSPFPALNIAQRGAPWNTLLLAILLLVEHTRTVSGATHYVHKVGLKLPPLGKFPNVVVDLDAREATLGQAVAALAGVTKLDVGACSATPVRLKLRKVKLAEAIRALEYASGEKLAKGKGCAVQTSNDTTARLVATAGSGAKRAFVFEQSGQIVVGTTAPTVPAAETPQVKRTAAFVRGKRTPPTVVVETSVGWRRLRSGETLGDDVRTEIHDDGLHLLSPSGALHGIFKLAFAN